MNLSSKFLQDVNGTNFAPITTPNAVRWPNGDDLDDKLTDMGASGTNHKGGLTPDTPSVEGNTKFLREDATWADPKYETVSILPQVQAVNGIGNAPVVSYGIILYDYANDVFYYYDSGFVQFTHPTWEEFLYIDITDSHIYLVSGGTTTDVTSNPPIDRFVAGWRHYGNAVSVVSETEYLCILPFSAINTTTYTINRSGLPAGCSGIMSLANIPAINRVTSTYLSNNQSTVSIDGVYYDSLANCAVFGNFTEGCELHVFAEAGASVTITLPTTYPYALCGEDSALTLDAGEIAEINFVCCGGVVYVKAIKSTLTRTYI